LEFEHAVWSKTFGGSHYDEGCSIIAVDGGGFAMSGRTQGFDALPQDEEVWIVRCDQDGNHLWNKTYGGGMVYGGPISPAHHTVTLTNSDDGGYLITSHTTHFGSGDVNGWLINTNENGDHLWNYTYGGVQDEVLFESIACSDGGYISVGYSENISAGIINAWVLRTDTDGNQLWNYTYGESGVGELLFDVIEVSSGGYLMAGWLGEFSYAADTTGTRLDAWLLRTDASGNHLWNQTYGGSSVDTATQIVQCGNGNFAFCGISESHAIGEFDAWLVRTDSSGQALWNQTFGGDKTEAAFAFDMCQDGGFAIFTLTYTDARGTSDAWFVRTDSDGNHMWNQTYAGNQFEQFYGGIATTDGFVAIGKTHSFGAGNGDMWVVKIPDEPPTPTTTPTPPDGPWSIDMMVIIAVGSGIVVVLLLVIALMRGRT
jgi:hypothetical protein